MKNHIKTHHNNIAKRKKKKKSKLCRQPGEKKDFLSWEKKITMTNNLSK